MNMWGGSIALEVLVPKLIFATQQYNEGQQKPIFDGSLLFANY